MYKTIQNQYISILLLLFLVSVGPQNVWAAFTVDDEKKLGKEIYDKLEKNNFLLQDKRLNAYVSNIGNRLLSHSNKAPFDFTFSIFNSSAINAFATPGGYIYINKGLITAVENEAQLAGVLAHEIAHANSRHIAGIIDKSRKLNVAMLAAIVAGALLGGGGEASAAIAAFSMAGATSLQLKYTRDHEEEADRMGITYLVDSGYYPAAMIEFLRIIKQYEFYSKTIPSYLSTHPGTDDRIFYLDSLLQTQYRRTGGADNIVGNFLRMQTLISLDQGNLGKHYRQLTESLKKDPRNVDLLYALALTEDQLGHTGRALEHLNTALVLSPQDKDILKHIGLLYLKTNSPSLALVHLKKAAEMSPDDDNIILALGRAYYATADFQHALNCFLKIQDKTLDILDINYHIAMSYGRLNQHGQSHYYFGLYFKKEKKYERAIFHLKKALEYYPENSPKAQEIKTLINDINLANNKKTDEKTDSSEKNDKKSLLNTNY